MSPTSTQDDSSVHQDATDVADVPDLSDRLEPDGLDAQNDEQVADDTEDGKDVVQEDSGIGQGGNSPGQLTPDGPPEAVDAPTAPRSPTSTLSPPDDTPSVQGSLLSSPRSETTSLLGPSPRNSAAIAVRPFDLRFQSRLSSYSLQSPRASSPAFLGGHSRQSSTVSASLQLGPEPDESSAAWDVIRWHKMRRVNGQTFSETGKRNFGRPTCLAVTEYTVVGTSKGIILVFDQQEIAKAVIGSGTKATECGAVTSLAISADHTTVAAGHSTGHIFTWEIAKSGRPFLHIPPVDGAQAQGRRADGHVSGAAVVHAGFLGWRHTALVTADDRGMAFSHLAARGMGAVGRTVRTTRILGRYPDLIQRPAKSTKQSSVLAFAPLPLGNIGQGTDPLGLVAMMTPYLLVIVSTTPLAQTQHKTARPREVAAHGAMSAALAWFPAIKLKAQESAVSRTKLVYCWSNVLTVLEIEENAANESAEKTASPDLAFVPRSRYTCEEAIVGVQWISRSVLAVLTITQQLLIVEDVSMHVTDSFDLLQKHVYHSDLYSQQLSSLVETLDEEDPSMHGVVADAFHMSFRAYKGRLYLLGNDDLSWGSLTNWADRLLALIAADDFIGAIKLATSYYSGSEEKATIGLPEDDGTRATVVHEKLTEMILASLRYAFGRNQQAGNAIIGQPQLVELATACIEACISINDQQFLFAEVFDWYEEHNEASVFLDVLEPFILEGQVTSLPPLAVKALISTFAISRPSSHLEEMICLLDTETMDIDQVASLCRKYNLYDAYIYVWNKSLRDYTTPLRELLTLAETSLQLNGHTDSGNGNQQNAKKIFPYMSFTLTGRTYPTGVAIEVDEEANSAKAQIYQFFFSGTTESVSSAGAPRRQAQPFQALHDVLTFDTPSFISVLNEAFEDSFLNQALETEHEGEGQIPAHGRVAAASSRMISRQFIVRIMLDVLAAPAYSTADSIYLDMFIARNLPKYPQYILLSGSTLQQIVHRLCHFPDPEMRNDAQLSIEYLMSVYYPANVSSLVPDLKAARLFRVLRAIYRQERQFADYIGTYFVDPDYSDGIFEAISDCMGPTSDLSSSQREEVVDVIKAHIVQLVELDVARAAQTLDHVERDIHSVVLHALEDHRPAQFRYLETLFEPNEGRGWDKDRNQELVELYIRLMCYFRPFHVKAYLKDQTSLDLRLEEVLPFIEDRGIVDAAVVLLARQGRLRGAMDRLLHHLETLRAALSGIQGTATTDQDPEATTGAATDLVESVRKYVSLGVWLCRSQSQALTSTQNTSTAGGTSASKTEALSFIERMWLDLINVTVSIARDMSLSDKESSRGSEVEGVSFAIRSVIQEVFTALLSTTASAPRPGYDATRVSFLNILQSFLSHAATTAPSLAELRAVLATIFSAYAYEESLLALTNSMLDKDVFVHVEDIGKLRQQGWRPKGQVCEMCRRRVWGPGLGTHVWNHWLYKESARSQKRAHAEQKDPANDNDPSRGKGKGAAEPTSIAQPMEETGKEDLGPIAVFSCRHIYHQKCLWTSQGSEQDVPLRGMLVCPACA